MHPFQHFNTILFRLVPAQALVDGEHLFHLLSELHGGIQGLHGILVNHGDLITPQAPQFFAPFTHQVFALEFDCAPFYISVGPQKIDDGPGTCTFAAAGLPHDAMGFAFFDIQGDILYRFHFPARTL